MIEPILFTNLTKLALVIANLNNACFQWCQPLMVSTTNAFRFNEILLKFTNCSHNCVQNDCLCHIKVLDYQSFESCVNVGQTPALALPDYFRIQELQYIKTYRSHGGYHVDTQNVQHCPYFMLACSITYKDGIFNQKSHVYEKVVNRLGVLIVLILICDRLTFKAEI